MESQYLLSQPTSPGVGTTSTRSSGALAAGAPRHTQAHGARRSGDVPDGADQVEVSQERYIDIPDEVRGLAAATPLMRAIRLERPWTPARSFQV